MLDRESVETISIFWTVEYEERSIVYDHYKLFEADELDAISNPFKPLQVNIYRKNKQGENYRGLAGKN